MNVFLELTYFNGGSIFVNMNQVIYFKKTSNGTSLFLDNVCQRYIDVLESPEEIMDKIKTSLN